MQKNNTKIICITGYSGSGKTEATPVLASSLPNSKYIGCDDYLPDYLIQFPTQTERVFGEPVTTKDGLEYFKQFEPKLTAESWKKWHDDFLKFANPKLTSDVDSIISSHEPRFLIIEHMALPFFDIWNKTDYKILIFANDIELLVKKMEERDKLGCSRETVMKRHFGVKEYLDNTTYDCTIGNNYNESFYYDVKNLAPKIIEMFEYQ